MRPLTYDQEKVKELRMAVIHSVLDVINESPEVEGWSKYKKDLILKMSPRVLPLVNEVSGPEGSPIPLLNVLDQQKEDA